MSLYQESTEKGRNKSRKLIIFLLQKLLNLFTVINMNDYNFKTAELFAGIGGIRLGFEMAGFTIVYALDNDKHCKETYDLNFSSTPLHLADIKDANIKDIPDFNILVAGFPCQPFSIAGQRAGFNDKERGGAFFHMMEILDNRKPEVIFLENVKHLYRHDKGKTYSVIKQLLIEKGYCVKEAVLNSAEYGNVPQNRERIYIVAFRSKKACEAFHFPGKIPLIKKVEDALDKEVAEKYYYRKGWLYDRIKDELADSNFIYQWRRVYLRKGSREGVCFTLTANMGTGGHNVPLIKDKRGLRKLTPRECARLQGFNESYKFPEKMADSQLYKQIGNSVTITLIARIASNIKRALNRMHRLEQSAPILIKTTNYYDRHVLKGRPERNNVPDPLFEYQD